VIITTKYKGTYYGELKAREGDECVLTNARMVRRWGTTNGVDQLAKTGPTERSVLGDLAAEIWLCGLTSVVDCTPAATEAWRTR
jgi:hypothetical protein